MYALIIDEVVKKYPYSIGQLRRDNPQTSFPKQLSRETLEEWNVFEVKTIEPPVENTITKNIIEFTPALINGVWTQVWGITDASPNEIKDRIQEKSLSIRFERNNLLQQSDWIVTMHSEKGTNIPEEWALYRQALRDITLQPEFPYSVAWPTKPTSTQ
jgi:hypothetical protein